MAKGSLLGQPQSTRPGGSLGTNRGGSASFSRYTQTNPNGGTSAVQRGGDGNSGFGDNVNINSGGSTFADRSANTSGNADQRFQSILSRLSGAVNGTGIGGGSEFNPAGRVGLKNDQRNFEASNMRENEIQEQQRQYTEGNEGNDTVIPGAFKDRDSDGVLRPYAPPQFKDTKMGSTDFNSILSNYMSSQGQLNGGLTPSWLKPETEKKVDIGPGGNIMGPGGGGTETAVRPNNFDNTNDAWQGLNSRLTRGLDRNEVGQVMQGIGLEGNYTGKIDNTQFDSALNFIKQNRPELLGGL